MKNTLLIIHAMLISIMTLLLMSCSTGSNSPVDPAILSFDLIALHDQSMTQARTPLAVFDAVIDPETKTFTVTHSREANFHYPLSNMYPNVLQVERFGFNPSFWADIKLTHPFPGLRIAAFDPRVIAILPAHIPVSFDYPSLNVQGNNRVILEPDGYTPLFDNPAIPGNVNPFKAYFKNQPNRIWSGLEVLSETQRWNMDIDGFAGPLIFQLLVDVSTNYPDPIQPGNDNAPEPAEIQAVVSEGLTQIGGSATLSATILDWQGVEGILAVAIEAPNVFDSIKLLSYNSHGPNPDEYIYTRTISNDLLATAGKYNYLVAAKDRRTGISIYQEFALEIVDVDTKGKLIWAKQSVSDSSAISKDVKSLNDDTTVVTGYFHNSVTFGKNEPNQTTLTSAGSEDIFFARYDTNGSLLWAKQLGSFGFIESGESIAPLSDYSFVLLGQFIETVVFGEGESYETTLSSNGGLDLFIARYNPDGSLQWVKKAGGTQTEWPNAAAALSDNSVIITGSFGFTNGSAIFGEGEPNETILVCEGQEDIFVAKYNPDGHLAWAKKATGTGYSKSGRGVSVLNDNSFVVAGEFIGSVTFGIGEVNQTILTSDSNSRDIFIAKYNSYGSLLWAKRAGGSLSDEALSISTVSSNSVVITGDFASRIDGSFGGTATFGEGELNETTLTSIGKGDIFIARYSSDGSLVWARSAGGIGNSINRGTAVTSLSNGSSVITGYFWGTATFGENLHNETTFISNGNNDIFIAIYNFDGTFQWAKQIGGTSKDSGLGVTSLSNNNIVATGAFAESVTFGLGEPNETILNANLYSNIFIAKLFAY